MLVSDRSKSSTATSSDSKDRVENDSHAVNAAHVRFDDIVRVASFVVASKLELIRKDISFNNYKRFVVFRDKSY